MFFVGRARLSPRSSSALATDIDQRLRDHGEHFSSMTHTLRRDPHQRANDSRFDRSGRCSHKAVRRGMSVQSDASTISSVGLTPQKFLFDESLEYPGDRTRVQMDDARELSSRKPRAAICGQNVLNECGRRFRQCQPSVRLHLVWFRSVNFYERAAHLILAIR
jgi:hypothetical protein